MKRTRILVAAALVLGFLIGGIFYFKNSSSDASVRQHKDGDLYSLTELRKNSKHPSAIRGDEPPDSKGFTDYVIPKIGLEDLTSYLQDDKVCKIENSDFDLDDAAYALLGAPDSTKVDAETDKVLLDVFNKKQNPPKGPAAENILKFFNALMYADLFFGSESNHVDYAKAHTLLEELKTSDPDNGAFSFVDAFVLSKLNVEPIKIKNEFLLAFQKKSLEFYSDLIYDRLAEKSFANASYWLVFIDSQVRLDQINLAPLTFYLYEFIKKQDPNFNRGAVSFAEKLFPAAAKEGIYPHLNFWESAPYIFAEKILSWAWPSAYPEKPQPKYEKIKRVLMVDVTALDQGTQAFADLKKSASNFFTCKREAFDIWYTQSKVQHLEKRE